MKQCSLPSQFGAIFLGFLLLVVSAVAATFWLAQTQQQDAAIINLAGRQRMLAQQMARLALTEPDDPVLAATAARFAQTLTALTAGGQASMDNGRLLTLPSPTDSAICARLDETAVAWTAFQTQLRPPVDAPACKPN